jgi:hypothetical protein
MRENVRVLPSLDLAWRLARDIENTSLEAETYRQALAHAVASVIRTAEGDDIALLEAAATAGAHVVRAAAEGALSAGDARHGSLTVEILRQAAVDARSRFVDDTGFEELRLAARRWSDENRST